MANPHRTACRVTTAARQHRQVAHGTRPEGSAWAVAPCIEPRRPLRGPWHEEAAAIADAVAASSRKLIGLRAPLNMWVRHYWRRVLLKPSACRRMTREVR